ncbi:MAG: dolichyl-phosphate beta-D-mannosyltransferase [Alteromonadaceae bacterium]|nr:MAG: dolichyl-phosphate beta-D-mannosyltransferase [Alteromonadaceae bacterium]
MKIVCIIPTYNEKDNIVTLTEKLRKLYPTIHMLVVDDNSPDGTGLVAEKMKDAQLDVLHRKNKEGLGRAYIAGFTKALNDGADILIQMDADLSHDPIYIEAMLTAIKKYDVVIGSRYINGISIVNWSISRLFLSWFGNVYARLVTGIDISDLTGGYKCIRRSALEAVDLGKIKTLGYGFQIEMNYAFNRCGKSISEEPIIFYERVIGKSNMSKFTVLEAILKVPLFRFKKYAKTGTDYIPAAPEEAK